MSQPQPTFGRIIALGPDVQPDEYQLDAEVCTIGRAPTCVIVVRRNIVSRLHARIERDGPRYLLHDAGSANGTFVNGQRLTHPHLLQDRDSIGLGTAIPILRFGDPDPTFVPSGRLRYDDAELRFTLDQRPIELTPSQFRLLKHLYQHAGSLCTRESCAQAIWGRDYDPGLDAAALDRTIANLRSALRQIDPQFDGIATRRGTGYQLNI
jgi:DNA-binding response OmpR family regulator